MIVKEAINDNKNKKSIIVVIAMVLILAIGLFVGYKKSFSKKNLFAKNINKEYKKLERIFDDNDLNIKTNKPVLITSDFKFNIDVDGKLLNDEQTEEILDELNKLGISSQIGIDTKNAEALVRLKALYDDESILGIGGYFKNNSLFLELKDLFDKYIEIPIETTGTLSTGSNSINLGDINKEDVKYLLSKTKDIILDNLDEDDFKKSNTELKVNGKKVKVSKLSYEISEKTAYELYKNVMISMSKDSKYIKVLSKLSGEKEKNIKEGFENSVKMFELMGKSDFDNKTIATLSVYTKGVSGLSFEVGEGKEKFEVSYYYNDDYKVIAIKQNNKDLVNIKYGDNKIKVVINTDNGKMSLDINKEVKGKTTTYNYVLETEDAKIKGKVIKEVIKENKDGSGESKLSFEFSTIGVKLELSGNVKVEYKDKLKMPDTSDSIKAEDLEDGLQEIFEGLSDSELGSLLEIFA